MQRVYSLSMLVGLSLCAAQSAVLPGRSCAGAHPALVQGERSILQGRYAEARALFAASLADLERESAKDTDKTIPCLMDGLATAFFRMGQLKEALPWALSAVERSRTLPPNQTTAIFANNLAGLYLELGDLDLAERWAREAFWIASQTSSQNHPDQQLVRTTLAAIHAYRGDFARAEPLYRSALFHLEKSYGPSYIEVGLAAGNLADIYRVQERHHEALPLSRKAVGVLESISKSDNWQLLWARSGLMVSCARTGRSAEAESLARSALDAGERLLPEKDPRLSTLLHRVAQVKLSQQDYVSARNLIERALPILEAAYGAESPRMIASLQTYVYVLRATKDKNA